jgi:hypothetical protein
MKDIKEQISELREEFNRRIDELEKELKPEFKVSAWYKFNNHEEIKIFGAVDEDNTYLYDNEDTAYPKRSCTPATPQEIESHLRSVCDKYVGKKVKGLIGDYNAESILNSYASYEKIDDTFWMKNERHLWVCLYSNGVFAEILPSLKPKPVTREDFEKFLAAYEGNYFNGFAMSSFLNDYLF